MPLLCIFMAIAILNAGAQEPALHGNDAAITSGIKVDSPSLLLSWGAPIPSDTAYHLKIRARLKVLIVVQWNSVRIFGLPMDSVFLHYVTARTAQTRKWDGFHSIFQYFEPDKTARMKAILEQLFGRPKTSRSKRGQFIYIWQTTRFQAILTNRKRYGALNGHVYAYIGIPKYIL